MATTKTTESAKPTKSATAKHSPPSSKPGTGDKIVEGFDKSAAAAALDRTVVLDARVTRLEQLMEAAAEGSYMIKKAMRKLDGE